MAKTKVQNRVARLTAKLRQVAKQAANHLGYWQEGDKKWYVQEKGGYDDVDIYFYPLKKQKNGNVSGIMRHDEGAGKAKKSSVSKMDFKVWKEVPESKVPSSVKSKVQARRASVTADFLEELMKIPGPTPEELRESAIKEAIWDGAYVAHAGLGKHKDKGFQSSLGGNWPSKNFKAGTKETAFSSLISPRRWKSLARHGVRSVKDLPGDTPVEVWWETEYRPDYDFYDKSKVVGVSRWTTGYGYTTANGRRVYLKKGDMNSTHFATEGLRKFLSQLSQKMRMASAGTGEKDMRQAASKFNVGDLVKMSADHAKRIGPTGVPKDGLVLGNEGSFVIVLWNNADQPKPIHPKNIKMFKKGAKKNPPELKKKWKEFESDGKQLVRKSDDDIEHPRMKKYVEEYSESNDDIHVVVTGVKGKNNDHFLLEVFQGEKGKGKPLYEKKYNLMDDDNEKRLISQVMRDAKGMSKNQRFLKRYKKRFLKRHKKGSVHALTQDLRASTRQVQASLAVDFVKAVVDPRKFMQLRKDLHRGGDPESARDLTKIMGKLREELTPKGNVEAALFQLGNLTQKPVSPEMTANQIYKIKDLLGIR